MRVGRWFRIRYVAGARGGRWTRRVGLATLLLWAAALGVILFVMRQGDFFRAPAARAGLGAALGGAASNHHDRLRRGTVIDFLDVGRWWPVFNVADVAITAGALLALGFLR